jgi:hypothetical protein
MDNNIFGMNIVESSFITEVPRLQLSYNYCGTEEFKAEMNEWLKQKFGTYMPVYIIGGNAIAMHPNNVALLKMQTSKGISNGH